MVFPFLKNKNVRCVHHFEERQYNVYFKDSDGLMRDNPELLVICTKCGLTQPKALHDFINRNQSGDGLKESISYVPENRGNSKEERNRLISEQIKEEQKVFCGPLVFSWVIDGGKQIVTITEVPAIVGRDKSYADVVIDDKYVARIHARIDIYHDSIGSAFKITDLCSMNGTQIDGNAISGADVFRPGQTLSFGRVSVDVKYKED